MRQDLALTLGALKRMIPNRAESLSKRIGRKGLLLFCPPSPPLFAKATNEPASADLRGALILLKISQGKYSMIFSSCSIVGFGGVDFASERAEVYFSVIELNSCFPLSLSFVPFKAFVF